MARGTRAVHCWMSNDDIVASLLPLHLRTLAPIATVLSHRHIVAQRRRVGLGNDSPAPASATTSAPRQAKHSSWFLQSPCLPHVAIKSSSPHQQWRRRQLDGRTLWRIFSRACHARGNLRSVSDLSGYAALTIARASGPGPKQCWQRDERHRRPVRSKRRRRAWRLGARCSASGGCRNVVCRW